MAFGQRGSEDGGQRFDYVPQGAPNKTQAEKVKLRQSSSAAHLTRLALGGFAVALALVLAPFTVIPALKSYALNDTDPARGAQAEPGSKSLGSVEQFYGPDYVKRKLGFGSSADGRCAKRWNVNDSLGHRDAMHCYATYKPNRLCDAAEKQVFVALAAEYFDAENAMAFAHVVNTTVMQGQLPIPTTSRKSSTDVVQAFRVLAEKGYVTIDDFGWLAPSPLRIALKNVEAAEAPCSAG